MIILFIAFIAMQSFGLACILWAVESFRAPKNKTTGNKFVTISGGIILLIFGISLLWFGLFLIFGEFPTDENMPMWTMPISIFITFYLYFFLPKTKIWKNRGKAKQPIEDGTNLMFRLIGSGLMLVGAGHILFAIYGWLKNGVLITISLGDWGITLFKVNDLGRFDTGWWAINKVLNYIILDSSAALPLVVIGYIIHLNAKDD